MSSLVVASFSPLNTFGSAVNMLVLCMIKLKPGMCHRSVTNEHHMCVSMYNKYYCLQDWYIGIDGSTCEEISTVSWIQ